MTKVFMSFAGSHGQRLACGLADFFRAVWGEKVEGLIVPGDPGAETWESIRRNVERADLAMLCITPANLRSEWLHTEFGMLHSRLRDGCLIPVLVDLRFTDLDYPLKGFSGVGVTADSPDAALEIADRIGQEGPADVEPEQLQRAWSRTVEPCLATNGQPPPALQVGWNESRRLQKLIDHCHAVHRTKNDFRKYICASIVRKAESAAKTLHATQASDDIDAFVTRTTREMQRAKSIRALCGGKDWQPKKVKRYYRSNYRVAAHKKADPGSVVRVFLEPPPGGEFSEREWKAIRQHHDRRKKGHKIEARILRFENRSKLRRLMPTVFDDLVGRGFGFAIVTSHDGTRSVFTHLGHEGAQSDDDEFRWASYEDPIIVSVIAEVFENLYTNSETYKPKKWRGRGC